MSIDYKKKYLKYKHKYLHLKGGDGHDDLRREFIDVLCNIEKEDKMKKFLLNFKNQITTPEKYNIFIDNLEVSVCGQHNKSVELLILDLKTIVQVNLSNINPIESAKKINEELNKQLNNHDESTKKDIHDIIETNTQIITKLEEHIEDIQKQTDIIIRKISHHKTFFIRVLGYGNIIKKHKVFKQLFERMYNILIILLFQVILYNNINGGGGDDEFKFVSERLLDKYNINNGLVRFITHLTLSPVNVLHFVGTIVGCFIYGALYLTFGY